MKPSRPAIQTSCALDPHTAVSSCPSDSPIDQPWTSQCAMAVQLSAIAQTSSGDAPQALEAWFVQALASRWPCRAGKRSYAQFASWCWGSFAMVMGKELNGVTG